ncbi:hypothetical protein [Variovorax sp. RA8]|uniref:hypothetical protein n=1 Tax=Variovorax sp. (strain JCM 16519 / RA8) TaxID=662548 RepID=UPI0013187D25|nr:hypothetical protein [Variovorax sp. RA8]VTU42877.1 hypothetical protein RA8P1_00344 [Variovorax sp. RA8]
MIRSPWTLFALGVIVAVSGGGAYYYVTHAAIHQKMPSSAADSLPVEPFALQDDDVSRKTLESIGSVRKLKPVPLQPAPQR